MRLDYPATGRNREAILSVLQEVLRPGARVLEVASGSGQHAAFLAPRLQVGWWQPSDPEEQARVSIDAWREDPVLPALRLDVRRDWPALRVDVVVCINMVHISPWTCTLGLLDGAAEVLEEGGRLYLYGPYLREGVPTAPSNLAFDQSLRSRNRAWGVRSLEKVVTEASARGLAFDGLTEMPANNLSLWFAKESSG